MFIIVVSAFALASCGVIQSAIKSTFPYTAVLHIPRSAQTGVELQATATAASFDQRVQKDGTGSSNVKDVRVISAKLTSHDPSDFNLGNLVMVKIYIAKADGSNEVLVAFRTDITQESGGNLVLDIDNSRILDEQVREAKTKIRMVYKLHNHVNQNTSLRLVLGLSAHPGK